MIRIPSFNAVRNRLLRLKNRWLAVAAGKQTLHKVVDRLEAQLLDAEDLRRATIAYERKPAHKIKRFDGTSRLQVSVMSSRAPWLTLTPERYQTPAMISMEEMQYYSYIGAFYAGIGHAVEIGPWLGASTQYIVRSLAKNPNFTNRKLYVIDDFVWRAEWMNSYVSDDEKLPNHACFRHLFDNYTSEIRHLLSVKRAKLTDYDGNDRVEQFSWDQGLIEFLYVDCGRTIVANEAWYKHLHQKFIPGRTLLMMQDWRLHRERPRKWYNQTLLFTESKGSELELLHEVSKGGLATFLFVG
jgi:hypothetical protein